VKTIKLIYSLGVALCFMVASSGHAAIYTGSGPGESTIGTGGDYASLNAVCEAINSQPLSGGDWTFLILNDLNEPANSSIIQDQLNGNRITLRPAPGTSSTVTFTTTAVPSDNTGHLTIGAVPVPSPAGPTLMFRSTHNITIDGCNTPGGSERNLTFRNSIGSSARTIIVIFGDSDYINVRNCNFESNGVRNITSPQYRMPTTGIDFIPLVQFNIPSRVADYAIVENCNIVYTQTVPASGISLNWAQQPLEPTTSSKSVIFRDNNVSGTAHGIKVAYTTASLIADNHIVTSAVSQLPVGESAIGILSSVDNGIQILRNQISFFAIEPRNSLHGILQYCPSPHKNIVADVRNNMIRSLRITPALQDGENARVGIQIDTESPSTTTLSHNSIDMYQDPAGLLTHTNSAAIFHGGLSSSITGKQGTLIAKNNILRMTMRGGFAIRSRGTSETVISDRNDIFLGPNSLLGTSGVATYATMAAWQTGMGSDLNSISQDPYVAAGPGFGTWIGPMESASADLHFTSYPGPLYLAPPLPEVTHDIDGDLRNSTAVVMGADEMEHPNAGVDNWSIY